MKSWLQASVEFRFMSDRVPMMWKISPSVPARALGFGPSPPPKVRIFDLEFFFWRQKCAAAAAERHHVEHFQLQLCVCARASGLSVTGIDESSESSVVASSSVLLLRSRVGTSLLSTSTDTMVMVNDVPTCTSRGICRHHLTVSHL